MNRERKVFVFVSALNIILCLILIYAILYSYFYRLHVLNSILFIIIFLILAFILVVVTGSIGMMICVVKRRGFILQKPFYMIIKFLFPFYKVISKVFRISSETLDAIFTDINNYIVENKNIREDSSKLMVIAPLCLQNSECPNKITNNINNCKHCNKCNVDELLDLCNTYSVNLAVVSGGSSARRAIIEKQPKAVIAIACERDLSSGIRDTKVPVIGIPNIRPNGPCYNTQVDIGKVKETIEKMLKD